MSKFRHLLKDVYENAYDLSLKKQYSEPNIYDAGGDLSKRWYVYYSFRNPQTGKLERQNPIDNGVNSYKTLVQRNKAIEILQNAVSTILENGYNPYEDESNFNIKNIEMGIADAFKFVRELKKSTMEPTSYTDFKSRITQFENWLLENGYKNRYISKVTKKAVISYLNSVQLKSSPKNRNNTKSAIGTFFQVLEDNEIVANNFVDKINVLKSKPVRNKTFSNTQDLEILEYLENENPVLALYVKFICYTILRPIEICRLKVRDVDTKERKIYVKTKTKTLKTKIIPLLLLEQLPDLQKLEQDSFLFGKHDFGQLWDATDTNRRGYFTNAFKAGVKVKFNLDENYNMYSFKHTYITKIYNKLVERLTPFEAKSELMLITGHTTMSALEKYLRDIDAVLPADYSKYISSKYK